MVATGLSLTAKRWVAGAYLSVLLICTGSYCLEWHLFGGYDKKVLAVAQFVGVVLVVRYGSSVLEEIREYRDAKRRASSSGGGDA